MRRLIVLTGVLLLFLSGCRSVVAQPVLNEGVAEGQTGAAPRLILPPTTPALDLLPRPAELPALPSLPVEPGLQPNGSFVTVEMQRADLTGDGEREYVLTWFWQDPLLPSYRVALQVDVLTVEGWRIYTLDTWGVRGIPSQSDLETLPLESFDYVEDADVRHLTDAMEPQLVVRTRVVGSESVLSVRVISLAGGHAEVLLDYTAYKGHFNYVSRGLRITQPLHLDGEPACCPCSYEAVTFTWDGEEFATAERLRESLGVRGEGGCLPPPTAAEWREVEVEGERPGRRRDAVFVHDEAGERAILFGGRRDGEPLSDTWALDLASMSWSALDTPDGLHPPARYGAAAAMDEAGRRLFVAGGAPRPGLPLDDIWVLDLETDTWELLDPGDGPRPAPREGLSGDLEAGGLLYLTHGLGRTGCLSDTWVLNLRTGTWQDRTLRRGEPSPRTNCSASIGARSLLLVGGCGKERCPLDETWELDLATGVWTEQGAYASGPPARQFAATASFEGRAALWLYGGLDVDGGDLDDVWVFDGLTGLWQGVEVRGPRPQGRHSHAAITVTMPDEPPRLLIFGGKSGAVEHNDLWMLLPLSG
jgi:hypothetical protein